MEENCYSAVNREKTILMKRTSDDFIIHGLFLDNIKTASTVALTYEFLERYSKVFEITGGRLMDWFIRLSVEQTYSSITLHLEQYISDAIGQYKTFATKSLQPKITPMQPGSNLSLSSDDSPATPDPRRQTHYRLMIATLQFAETWMRFDITFAISQLARFVLQQV
jgi:hypothetical protein